MKRARFTMVALLTVFFCLISKDGGQCFPQVKSPPSSQELAIREKPKILVVYYSRTGNTRAIAESIKETLGCDIQEIKDLKDRSGISGFIGGMIDSRKNPITDISPKEVESKDYDLLIIGSPGWGVNLTPAINTFITMTDFTQKKVVLFGVVSGRMSQKTLDAYSTVIASRGGQVIDTFVIKTLWINQDAMREEAKKICTERKEKWMDQ